MVRAVQRSIGSVNNNMAIDHFGDAIASIASIVSIARTLT